MGKGCENAPDVAQDGGGAGGGVVDRVGGSIGGGGDLSPTSCPDAMVSVSWGRGLAAAVVAVGFFCLYSFLRAPPIGCVGDSVNLRLSASTGPRPGLGWVEFYL